MKKRVSTSATVLAALLTISALAASPASAASVDNVRNYDTTIWGSNGVNFRTGPSYNSTVKALLAAGDRIQVSETAPPGFGGCEWYRVTLLSKSRDGSPKGTTGWVNWVYVRKLVLKGTQGC